VVCKSAEEGESLPMDDMVEERLLDGPVGGLGVHTGEWRGVEVAPTNGVLGSC
jgi:hypothetical protein